MSLIDAHCHLHEPWFSNERLKDVVKRCQENNISKVVNCASDLRNYDQVIKSGEIPEFSVTLGIQPTIAADVKDYNFTEFFGQYLSPNFKAIGEVGLDYYWVKVTADREIQKQVFAEIIKSANNLELPLVIHSRKAETDCLNLLEKYAEVPVLLHSFDGNLQEVKRAMDLGYLISIPTNVTIRKKRRKTAKRAGIENIVLETDAPFCAPSDKIEQNEPMYLHIAAKRIALELEIEESELAKITSRNATKFYNL